ncbi:MAG: hypothetical protein AMK75_05115 [Planctomycetes bacterium SM23_65]|nr:MAG: hypothetical protein AMK75_05115 [Planctomycetes bacterium SM23_65]
MTFVHPAAYVLLALLIVPILLYLLPMPRRRVRFPSLLLWERMLRDRPSSQSWRWLRTLLSFLLQMAILVLLVLAVGKPVFSPAEGKGDAAVIVLDVSASMKAPVSPGSGETRFERARELARNLLNGMPSAKPAALITAGSSPVVLSGLTDQRSLLLSKLNALVCTDGRTNLKSALELALELSRGGTNADVYLLSDGHADVSGVSLAGARLHYFRTGQTLPNVGIVDFRARRGFDFPEEYQALARLESTFDSEQTVELSLVMDDNVVETRTVKLAPRSSVSESFRGKIQGVGSLEARLKGDDAFAADDVAHVLLGKSEKLQTLLVSDKPDRFLESALTANRAVTPFVATLQQYLDKRPEPDILIFNGVLPPELPDGNLLIIDPPTGSSLFQLAGEVTSPEMSDWGRTHPILAGATLKDVYIPTARALKPLVAAEVLARCEGGPLMFAAQTPERRLLVVAFDPGTSSITFRVAFPVIIANAFRWMTDEGTISNEDLRAGDEVLIRLTQESPAVEVKYPDGRTGSVESRSGVFPVSASEVGVYEVVSRLGRKMTFAANLADASESDLTVADELKLADTVVRGRDRKGAGLGEFWFIAAVLALGLLALDWYLYHHRFVV